MANPQFAPNPDRRQDREEQLRRAEADIGAEETKILQEVAQLERAAGEILARLQQARAASSQAQLAGGRDPQVGQIHQRVHQAQVQVVDVTPHREAALNARAQAVQLRQKAAEQMRSQVSTWAAELSRLSSQLTADEAALTAFETRARQEAARQQETQRVAPVAAPPPAPAQATQVSRPQGRRAQTRVRMQAAVDLHTDTNFFTGFSTNLSEGGLFVATIHAPSIGTEIDLAFTLPGGEKLTVHGVVRWTREVNDRTPEIFPGVGVQFTNLDEATAQAIQTFVEAREPMFFPE